jgi:hypothetical protein
MLLTEAVNQKVFRLSNAKGETTEALIQAISPRVWRGLLRKHNVEKLARKEQLTKKPVAGMLERYSSVNIEAASLALIDFNPARKPGYESQLPALTEESVAIFAKATKTDVKLGDIVTLDGCWTDEVKDHVFRDVTGGPGLCDWITEQAKTLGFQVSEDEEGKD